MFTSFYQPSWLPSFWRGRGRLHPKEKAAITLLQDHDRFLLYTFLYFFNARITFS